ncbi:Mo-dependent nitrogenase C-terminal domain-containing protein [Synechococcus sp. PCC 7336]|uniref:Mo-dependent nitrogenase C-terminal domain-containing protein n=1 Tax=Synechococcus sp. PCC 7336 TaxID=195250 RepID=UPI0003467F82|nr:Mo-dependent nitrogenase C-terminal domain-containing protein [Synechococcus sp. PCC 7336]
MTSATVPYTDRQIAAWLRGLLAIAWADGHYDPEEREAIEQLTRNELAPTLDFPKLDPIAPEELASELGSHPLAAENFMRTAVIVAVADGVYSTIEAEKLRQFQVALGLDREILKSLEHTLYDPDASPEVEATTAAPGLAPAAIPKLSPLQPVKTWLDGMEVHDPRVARFICKMVPAQCPFERDVTLFGKKVIHIPPMCKLNPLYDQLVGLRFRSLSYLADDCGEDVSDYC